MDSDLGSLLELNVHHEHLWPLANWYMNHWPANTIHIRSNLYEIGRAFWRRTRTRPRLTADVMATTHRAAFPDRMRAVNAFDEYIEVTGFDEFGGYDPYDLFYWEHRMGRWHGNVLIESDVSHETWVVLNNRRVLESVLSVPLAERIHSSVCHGLIQRSWPVLHRWPVNASIDRVSRMPKLGSAAESALSGKSMNNDRISEVYKGEIWTESAQKRARSRINWMCSQATGTTVLDLGCSQGIASILLGREGFEVVGVDVQESRIEFAKHDLERESEATQSRVRFEVGDGTSLTFEDGAFDTVLLGEVIEHMVAPNRILEEVARVMAPEGRVVLTTPFGVLHHHDHKQTFYPRGLAELIWRHFDLVSAGIEDGYYRIVAGRKNDLDDQPGIVDGLLDAADAAVREIQEELARSRIDVLDLQNELAAKNREAVDMRRDTGRLAAELTLSVSSAREAEASKRGLEQRVADLDRQVRNKEKESKALTAELSKLRGRNLRLSGTADELRQRIDRLEYERSKLRDSLSLTRWRLQSLKARRWWRIGVALGQVRKRPLAFPNVVREALRSSALPARPELSAVPITGAGRPAEALLPTFPMPSVARALPIPRRPIPVAMVADMSTITMFRHEWQVSVVGTETWRAILDEERPEMLVAVRSGPNTDWGSVADHFDELTRTCKTRGVPTVLWDKDPFLPTEARLIVARLFDVVLATSQAVVDAYRLEIGTDLVHQCADGVQTRVYNPAWIGDRSQPIVVLAQSVTGVPREGAESILDAALPLGLEVLDEAQSPGVSVLLEQGPPVRYTDQLPESPKVFALALADMVDHGDTCPPDVLAIAATNTAIVSPVNPVVGSVFSESVVQLSKDDDVSSVVRAMLQSDVLRARNAHQALRIVMESFTLEQRASDMLRHVGLATHHDLDQPGISVVIPTNRPSRMDHLLDSVARQTCPEIELVLVAHGIDVDSAEIEDWAQARGIDKLQVVEVAGDVILGEALNRGFERASFPLIAKMDDDDYYGDNYLRDLALAKSYSEAEVVGKWAHFAYLEGINTTVYRYGAFEHRYHNVLAASTLLMSRDLFDTVQFPAIPVGEGTAFLKEAGSQGARIYASDRFNYIYMRYSEPGHHTFPVTDFHLAATSSVVCQGMALDHVTL